MSQFVVLLRAIKHVTAEVVVEVETEDEAREIALHLFKTGVIKASESDAEDERIESVQKGS
jgi:hypothetical protein